MIVLSNKISADDGQKTLETITMKCNMKGDMTYMNENPAEYPRSVMQWNIEALSKAFKEIYPTAAWIELIKFLDVDTDAREEFYFQTQESFDIFMNLWSQLKPQNRSFPLEFLIANTWKNKKAQVICLDYAVNYSYTHQDILFEKAKRRQDALNTLQNIKSNTSNYLRIWKCIDLVQTLVTLSDSPYYYRVRSMFDAPIKFIPEYLLLTLIKTKTKSGKFLVEELYSQLLPTFLTGHVNSIPVLTEIWNADKTIVINAMSELYKRNSKAMNLSRVLDISQSIKNSLLEIITTTKDYNFALQLGMLGAKRDFLHFENWIVMLIKQEGDPFVRCLFKYIDVHLIQPAEEVKEDAKKVEKVLERSQLSEEKLAMIYENLHQICENNPDLLDYETRQQQSESFSKVVQLFPNIHTEPSNNEEIENRANEYFQQLYKGEKEVEDLVNIMKDFRSSQNPTERETYACMVQNLFDEWKFFPKYPKKELWMTARLFGKIISEKKIIDGVVTDIGLKCIVEGLKREGKMFDFAITALEECKDSIDNETGLKNILTCKQLQEKKPELYEFINVRYKELFGVVEEQVPLKQEKVMPAQPPMHGFNPPIIPQTEPVPPREMPQIPSSSITPDPRLADPGFHPGMVRGKKPGQPMNPLMNTPTQPGKYFNDQPQMPGLNHTPQQMTRGRMFYGKTPSQQRGVRPFDSFNLGPAAMEGAGASMAPRALNLSSKDFKPKTQQVQEYLKKEDVTSLPQDFMDNLITTLNMTGTEQIRKNSEKLEAEIKNEYISGIAHFIVVRRVIESDEKRIEFFSSFFHCMKNKLIVRALIAECISVILKIIMIESADPNAKNEVTRAATTPVKNVACFLGYLTLVHNQPLLSKDLDLKQLLLEAHEKKCMGIAVLVVCKILRTGEKSRIFTPHNPWMIGLYSMLIEYLNYYSSSSHDYDKNIDKEINLVLRNRGMELNHSKESTLFRDFDQKNYNNKEFRYLHLKMTSDPLIIIPEIPVELNEISKEESKSAGFIPGHIPSGKGQDIVIIAETSKKFPELNPDFLKALANQGINQAMREIIEAVIRRVIPIASITTRLLVLKDFALEPDPEKLKQASVSTARSLAGMLAQITCKDILKYQFAKSLKDLVLQTNDPNLNKLTDENKKELIETIIKENSDIGCNKIIAEVQKEALNNISKDDSILEAIQKRERFRIDGTDFRDLSNSANFSKLPNLLKPSDDGLTDIEFQVYKDFENIPNTELEQHIQDETARLLDDDEAPVRAQEETKSVYNQSTQEQQIVIEKFISLCASYSANETKIIEFNTNFKKELAEIKALMSQVENSQELLTETFLNQRKHIALNSSLVVNLIENKIIALKSWQKRFAFHLNQSVESMNDPEIIDFVELFIVRGVLDKGSIKDTAIPDLVACIENFSRVKNNPNTLRWKSILNLFNTSTLSSALYEELAMVYFNQWVNETDLSSLKPKFCYKLSVVFKHTQHMAMFIKNSLKTCLETVQKDEEDEGYLIYPLLNKFTSMIIVCSFNWISPPGVKLVNIIDEAQAFNTIWEVLDEYHTEKLIEFDQIPFKRIFVAFLKQFFAVFKDVEDFGDIDKIKKKYEVLMMFANLFKKMNPSKYPAFAFAWLELISSPCFLPLMLNSRSEYNTQERWFKLQELFNLLFGFLKENIYENSQNSPALEKFFEGTLKVSLVVLHDYPEFFCCYYFQFINHLPLYRTGNLRNMILAAYPKNIRLPDPNAEITKFETSSALLGQDRQTLLQQFTDEGDFYGLKADLDDYLRKFQLFHLV